MFTSDPEQVQDALSASPNPPTVIAGFRVVGLNYRTAELQTRSAVSFDDVGVRNLLDELRTEALVLSTCNRTEVYFFDLGFQDALNAIAKLTEVSQENLLSVTYQLSGREAVEQLFRVACGLDSAVLGEHEVLAQLKSAHRIAKQVGSIGRRLDPLYQRALRTSKRVRTESELGRDVTSIGGMALRKASLLAGGLKGKNVLLIGAGQIAERVAKGLFHAEGARGYVTNRTRERADKIATMYGLESCDFNDIDGALAVADVVVSAVSCPTPVITHERLRRTRQGRSVIVVDLGVPRNVEEGSKHDPLIRLVDMEAIVTACHANSQNRAAAVPHANEIVREEIAAYELDVIEREAAPYIKALSELAESVRRQNLDWAFAQNPNATDKERKLLEDLSIRIVRGILQAPIQALKSDLREPVERAVLARLFLVEAS